MNSELIGNYLVKEGKLGEEELKQAQAEHEKSGIRLSRILVQRGYAKEKDILEALSNQFNIPVASLSNLEVDEALARKIPAKFAYRYKIVPLKQDGGRMVVAVTDPFDIHALDELRAVPGKYFRKKRDNKVIRGNTGKGVAALYEMRCGG